MFFQSLNGYCILNKDANKVEYIKLLLLIINSKVVFVLSYDEYRPTSCCCLDYSPADYADPADKECSKLHYSAEKDSS